MLKSKPTVLVVEDLQETRQILYQVLSLEYDVLQTNSIEEAVFFCTQVPIDVVITDLNLEMSSFRTGFDLILELKMIGFKGKTVAMTGYAYDLSENERKILNTVDKFYEKPFSILDLMKWINETLTIEQNDQEDRRQVDLDLLF